MVHFIYIDLICLIFKIKVQKATHVSVVARCSPTNTIATNISNTRAVWIREIASSRAVCAPGMLWIRKKNNYIFGFIFHIKALKATPVRGVARCSPTSFHAACAPGTK